MIMVGMPLRQEDFNVKNPVGSYSVDCQHLPLICLLNPKDNDVGRFIGSINSLPPEKNS